MTELNKARAPSLGSSVRGEQCTGRARAAVAESGLPRRAKAGPARGAHVRGRYFQQLAQGIAHNHTDARFLCL